jgi:hypothetical protein
VDENSAQALTRLAEIYLKQAIELCKIGDQQASRLLTKLAECGILKKRGEGKGTLNEAGPSL